MITKAKNTVPLKYVISDRKGEEIEKELQKQMKKCLELKR